MDINLRKTPRTFRVGRAKPIDMKDWGTIHLASDEQVTFLTEAGGEYDVARKDWGFYATPSINSRLQTFGFTAFLVENPLKRYFILLVEQGREDSFERYLVDEELRVVAILDEKTLFRLDRETGHLASPSCMCGMNELHTLFSYDSPPKARFGSRSVKAVPMTG